MPDPAKPFFLALFFLFLCLNAAEVRACMCANLTAEDAFDKSAAVFTGKVVGFEYRRGIPNQYRDSLARETGEKVDYETKVVKILVERWWKGRLSRRTFLVTGSTRTALSAGFGGCDFNFKAGETYLIYAVGERGNLTTNACLRTRKAAGAKDDFKALGKGRFPVDKKTRRPKP